MPFEELANMPCQTCRGEKRVVQHTGKGFSNEWEECSCPDCQEDGQPTGLALPMLSDECDVCHGRLVFQLTSRLTGDQWTQDCVDCYGTGRILREVTVEALREEIERQEYLWSLHCCAKSPILNSQGKVAASVWKVGDKKGPQLALGNSAAEALGSALLKAFKGG